MVKEWKIWFIHVIASDIVVYYTNIIIQTGRRTRGGKRKKAEKRKKVPIEVADTEKHRNKRCHIEELPDEVLATHVFPKLLRQDLNSATLVCKRWNDVLQTDNLWPHALAEHHFMAYVERDLSLSTPMCIDKSCGPPNTFREACHSKKTRLFFSKSREGPEVIVHGLPYKEPYNNLNRPPLWRSLPVFYTK